MMMRTPFRPVIASGIGKEAISPQNMKFSDIRPWFRILKSGKLYIQAWGTFGSSGLSLYAKLDEDNINVIEDFGNFPYNGIPEAVISSTWQLQWRTQGSYDEAVSINVATIVV